MVHSMPLKHPGLVFRRRNVVKKIQKAGREKLQARQKWIVLSPFAYKGSEFLRPHCRGVAPMSRATAVSLFCAWGSRLWITRSWKSMKKRMLIDLLFFVFWNVLGHLGWWWLSSSSFFLAIWPPPYWESLFHLQSWPEQCVHHAQDRHAVKRRATMMGMIGRHTKQQTNQPTNKQTSNHGYLIIPFNIHWHS